ncbi:MAG: protein adenylyltransferase SelO family protein, partial [Arcobacteraceae bacterium]
VPVNPTPIDAPVYIAHRKKLFSELGFKDILAQSPDFMSMFSGDISNVPTPMSRVGWACGYALSIYGREYYDQCPFRTGNGYGDGRAVSVLETVLNDKRWEMQLKGGGRTPYCRGADGRAVLRSSVREFLAQEHMDALGVPTSRSLSLYTSKTEFVKRPWYSHNSYSFDPDIMVSEAVAISTRVAPSFLRVGHLELFARRTRKKEYPHAYEELEKLVLHLIDREYNNEIDNSLSLSQKVVSLADKFRTRLTLLVANWVRVGFCQGNFNGDNTAAGGFTLDYGPFGFCDVFDPDYQSWTGGGRHFAFLNQPNAAQRNFNMFCSSLEQLVLNDEKALVELNKIRNNFAKVMQEQMEAMWAKKLGLQSFDESLFEELIRLMLETSADYTIFFRELSHIPNEITALTKSFYQDLSTKPKLQEQWSVWFSKWRAIISKENVTHEDIEKLSNQMKLANPKYILREWILVPAYEKAKEGDYSLVRELQDIMTNPYAEQSKEVEDRYYKLKPLEFFEVGGISHLSCSS